MHVRLRAESPAHGLAHRAVAVRRGGFRGRAAAARNARLPTGHDPPLAASVQVSAHIPRIICRAPLISPRITQRITPPLSDEIL